MRVQRSLGAGMTPVSSWGSRSESSRLGIRYRFRENKEVNKMKYWSKPRILSKKAATAARRARSWKQIILEISPNLLAVILIRWTFRLGSRKRVRWMEGRMRVVWKRSCRRMARQMQGSSSHRKLFRSLTSWSWRRRPVSSGIRARTRWSRLRWVRLFDRPSSCRPKGMRLQMALNKAIKRCKYWCPMTCSHPTILFRRLVRKRTLWMLWCRPTTIWYRLLKFRPEPATSTYLEWAQIKRVAVVLLQAAKWIRRSFRVRDFSLRRWMERRLEERVCSLRMILLIWGLMGRRWRAAKQ